MTAKNEGYDDVCSLGLPSVLAENDGFRSRFVHDLCNGLAPTTRHFSETAIPKVIVQYWHDLERIPEDVQDCLDSWAILTKRGFIRLLFGDREARQFISTKLGQRHLYAYELCYHPAMRCDYFRLCYILVNGGFYVDADDLYLGTECDGFFSDGRLKVQPLCYDTVSGSMVSPDLFVRDGRYSESWIFYLNNNPIISPAYHPIIQFALERATRILHTSPDRPPIQSTTGPGNMTASLVRHALSCSRSDKEYDFTLLPGWETVSISVWPLSYRNDERNWRLFDK